MHNAFFSDPAVNDSNTYWMSDPATAARTRTFLLTRDPDPDSRLLSWGVIPVGVDPSCIRTLHIMGGGKPALPTAVVLPGLHGMSTGNSTPPPMLARG